MKLTETTVEEAAATAQARLRHGLDVFVSVAASEQRTVEQLILGPTLQSQLHLLFPASHVTARFSVRNLCTPTFCSVVQNK